MHLILIITCFVITAIAQEYCQIVGSEIDSNHLALLHVNTITGSIIQLYQDTQTKASRYYDKSNSEFNTQQDAQNWLDKYTLGDNYTCYTKSGITYMEKNNDSDPSGWIIGGSILGTVCLVILAICSSLFCLGCFVVFFVVPVILVSILAIILVLVIVFVAVNLICMTLTGASLVQYIKNLINKKYEVVNKTKSSEMSQDII